MNPMMPESLYLVQVILWEYVLWLDGPRYSCPHENRADPVEAFADADQAEACRAELEREKRAEVNPFEYCENLDELTCFDADRWHDWILDAGLEPPANGRFMTRDRWLDWWRTQQPTMTELQRAKMWQAMDKLRFYRVVELAAASSW